MFTKKTIIASLAIVLLAGAAGAASAETPWDAAHPRRDQVNDRLANQHHRVAQERREGEMSGRKAAYVHAEDHRIRDQERFYASRDHGHITKMEQARLNREENHVSRQVGR